MSHIYGTTDLLLSGHQIQCLGAADLNVLDAINSMLCKKGKVNLLN
jgi:hypothetical protein